MTDDKALIPPEEVEARRRDAAVLKAVGMDKLPAEQRELLLAISRKWDLSLELGQLRMIDGRPYITRDGLLWIAHRSGQLDGIEVTEPTVVNLPGVGEFWRAVCRVYRKDMTRPFEYAGRYPTRGGNQRYAPEMAVKVAESMALRRAFNVAVATVDERWDLPEVQADVDAVSVPQSPPRSLSERVQERRQATSSGEVTRDATPAPAEAPRPSTPGRMTDKAFGDRVEKVRDELDGIIVDAEAELDAREGKSVLETARAIMADEDDEVTQSRGVARLEDARKARGIAGNNPANAGNKPPPIVPTTSSSTADLVADLEPVCGDEDASPMALGFCELIPGHKSAHRSEHGSWPLLKT